MTDKRMYDEWVEHRRNVETPPDLTDRIMAAVEGRGVQHVRKLHLADRMNQSWFARWTACSAALAVGILPFLLVAYVAELLVF